jgi:hypothetical protein
MTDSDIIFNEIFNEASEYHSKIEILEVFPFFHFFFLVSNLPFKGERTISF